MLISRLLGFRDAALTSACRASHGSRMRGGFASLVLKRARDLMEVINEKRHVDFEKLKTN